MRHTTEYDGFLKIRSISLPHLKHKVEFMERGDSACALVYSIKDEAYLLLEQFRIGPFIREGFLTTYSAVAGMIDKGEEPTETIVRELKEETNLTPCVIQSLGWFYTSPGGTTEKSHLFYIEVSDITGLKVDTQEGITSVELIDQKTLDKMMEHNAIKSMQLCLAYQLSIAKGIF